MTMCQDVAGTPATLASEEAGTRTLLVSRGCRGFEALLLMMKTTSEEDPEYGSGDQLSDCLAPAKNVNFAKGREAGL